ncbi:3477_t:CDS:1 [Funneliformis geosporum]|nr:3477_t:CDS:1 [Funneliformis geosporum]
MADIDSSFPPEMSFDNYKLLSNLILVSFISLSFRSPKSFVHLATLITLTICFMIQPIIYRGKYPANEHASVAGLGIIFGYKMCFWLKKFASSHPDDDFQPFFYTLFYWRKNVTSGKKEDFQPTNKQILQNIVERSIYLFIRWIIYEGCFKVMDMYTDMNEIPSSPYFFRVLDMFRSGASPITMKSLLLCSFYMVLVYLIISINYDSFLMISGIILLFLNVIFPTVNDKESSFLKGKVFSVKRWCISFLFDTRYIFDSPWLSTSPRDLWSFRWHTFYNETWKGLGYVPLRNYLISSHENSENRKKLAQIGGTIGAFVLSGILHEYLTWTEMNELTFEQFYFFLFHGIIIVIWEFIFKKEKNNTQRVILFLIVFLSLPSISEPFLRYKQWLLPSTFTNINKA